MRPTFLSLLKADATREQLEEWCRSQAQSYTMNDGVVCRVLGKFIMYTLARDVALTPHLALDGIWEPWVTMAIARHVQPGMRCMDVGACYGYYALLMRDIVGAAGYVEAWEPIWSGVSKLNSNVNGLGMVIVRAAIASEEKTLGYELPTPGALFNAGDVPLHPYSPIEPRPQVVAKPPAAATYDFIKIDVEGAEDDVWKALAGVRELSPKLTVCMEFTPEKHLDPMAFLEGLMNDGFEVGSVGHDGVPRACSLDEALVPDTGGFRMLWLTRVRA